VPHLTTEFTKETGDGMQEKLDGFAGFCVSLGLSER